MKVRTHQWLYVFAVGVLLGLAAREILGAAVRRWRLSRTLAAAGKLTHDYRVPQPLEFVLNGSNSECMGGQDDPQNERWLDIAGNAYATEFARHFSYSGRGSIQPVVRVRYEPAADTFRGRLEARGLKPNFAYQMKLRGDYARDPKGFEAIGYTGRWRLPGPGTNFSDWDYRAFPDKSRVEAYILFDYFVTDRRGFAVKDFELSNTFHVLFAGLAQGFGTVRDSRPTRVIVDANDPRVYARPKDIPCVEFVWAQAEESSGRMPAGKARLPEGIYHATLVLTEESFHSYGDGGYWATVMHLPVSFVVDRALSP